MCARPRPLLCYLRPSPLTPRPLPLWRMSARAALSSRSSPSLLVASLLSLLSFPAFAQLSNERLSLTQRQLPFKNCRHDSVKIFACACWVSMRWRQSPLRHALVPEGSPFFDCWWCVVLLKRHSSIVRRPGRTCKHVRAPISHPTISEGVLGHASSPTHQPGATPTNNLHEQGLTL